MSLTPMAKLTAALAAAVLVGSLTGCSSDPAAPSGTAIVLGTHANETRIGPVALSGLADVIGEHTLTVAVTDGGQPVRIAVADLLAPLDGDSFTRSLVVDQDAKQFVTDAEAAVPSSTEANILGAIALAARDLAAVGGRRTIIVLASGLQTTGALPMQNGLLDAEPGDVVQALVDAGALPDLTGIDVRLAGLGATAGTQEQLDEAALRRLTDLWTRILKAAGAKSISTLPVSGTQTQPAAGLPAVTPVPVHPVIVKPPVDATSCTATFADASIGFEPDIAKFRDESATRATVSAAVAQLAACKGTVHLLGTTSSAGTAEGRASLSQARAEVVATLVGEALGRPTDGFDVRGLGYNTAEGRCVKDRNAAGALVEEQARTNRKVLLVIDPQ